MSAERWPTDPVFRKFAALIADDVMFARQCGQEIGPLMRRMNDEVCFCPEGAALYMRGFDSSHPTSGIFAASIGQEYRELASQFACGFERDPLQAHYGTAAYRLGEEYRRRFVDGPTPARPR